MKVLIIVETPDDDAMHNPRIDNALRVYLDRVRCGDMGRTGEAERLVVPHDLGPIRLYSRRIDFAFFRQKAFDALPRWAQRLVWRLV